MATMTGRCLCGQVHYTVTGDPAFSGICHCRNCQRYTGSAFETIVAFASEAIKVQGELKTYQDTGDSGQPVFRRSKLRIGCDRGRQCTTGHDTCIGWHIG